MAKREIGGTDRPDVAFFPPLGFLLATLLAGLLHWLMPLGFMPDGAPGILGVPVMAAAVGLAAWGSATFKRAGTNVNPRKPSLQIVESGPFRFTRNPMYLGMVVFQVGLALMFSMGWSLLLAPVLWAALHFGVVLREEAYLREKFGGEYTNYLARTRRWI